MLLIPIFAVVLGGAFMFMADTLTKAALQNAGLVALIAVGALFSYHVVVVADAFAGRLGTAGGLRAPHPVDYAGLLLLTVALAGLYGTIYPEAGAWAGAAARGFESGRGVA